MKKILLVGTGNIARDYVKVLRGLEMPFDVIGRSQTGCAAFSEEMGVDARPGGVESWERELNQYSAAIVAVDASQLADVSCRLMRHGVANVLIEKPGGVSRRELEDIVRCQEETESNAYIAYNRHFYASVLHAEKIIQEDGGVKSFHFEFTEWPHTVLAAGLPEETVQNWFLCNSTHVVDLAFYLGGRPKELAAFSSGSLSWSAEKSSYTGAGVSENGALFSYCANWDAPGRWNIEILTNQHRLIFRPVEKLQIQKLKSVKVEFVENINDELDVEYKPGLYREVAALLGMTKEDCGRLKTVRQQLDDLTVYEKIAGRCYN